MNANRTANVNLIDIRIDRAITIRGNRLTPFFDLYNVTNIPFWLSTFRICSSLWRAAATSLWRK